MDPLQQDRFPLLATLDDDALTLWQQRAESLAIPSGQVVLQQGAIGSALYLVEQGLFLARQCCGKRGVDVGEIQSGEIFGEGGLVRTPRVGADVIALQNSVLHRIPAELVLEQYAHNISFHRALDRVCSRRLMISALAMNPIFSRLPVGLRQWMEYIGESVEFASGEVLVVEGDMRFLYLLLSGRAERRLLLHDADNTTVLVSELGFGDGVGEVAIVLGGTNTSEVRALTPVRALRLGNKTIHDLRLRNLDFSLALYENSQSKMRHDMKLLEPLLGVEQARGYTMDRLPSFVDFQQPEKQMAPLFV